MKMRVYVFDTEMSVIARVTATTEAEAREKLRTLLANCDMGPSIRQFPDHGITLTEGCLSDEPDLFEIDEPDAA